MKCRIKAIEDMRDSFYIVAEIEGKKVYFNAATLENVEIIMHLKVQWNMHLKALLNKKDVAEKSDLLLKTEFDI